MSALQSCHPEKEIKAETSVQPERIMMTLEPSLWLFDKNTDA